MPERILIVDDEPVQRRLIETMLGRAGYDTVMAGGGEAAVAMLLGEGGPPIDAVVLDLVMPDLDGLGVLARMREEMHGLGQHRLTYEHRHLHFPDALSRPAVMPFCSIKERNEGSRISDGGVHRGPSPRGAWGWSQDQELLSPRRQWRPS